MENAVNHERWMARCLQLARRGATSAAPNPLVGSVLVQGDRALAEGWHERPGTGHAEVRCLSAFGPGAVPADATLYVNLEPCAHHGRTPPCADLIIARGIRSVVIGHEDPFPAVAGQGIARLRRAGISIHVGVLEAEARWLNRRFLTSIVAGRPYVVLKWARSADGLIDQAGRSVRGGTPISGAASNILVHRWRSEEQAILVGGMTVLHDDPSLTVRHVAGRQPLRVVLDRSGVAPAGSRLFTDGGPTLLFTGQPRPDINVEQLVISQGSNALDGILKVLHERQIRSVLVEGGARTHEAFFAAGLWDEARVIEAPLVLGSGTKAPSPQGVVQSAISVEADRVVTYARSAELRRPEMVTLSDPWC
ncbi:MAG: bifunctional diaminohydroxyphosphoribosylaminopyrimidine deaminase/5-amino-6-(5-phosphoribosylamino)uracil reductase RibD [Flavobacteriales bacterium]